MYLTTTPGIRYSTLIPLRRNMRTLVELSKAGQRRGGGQHLGQSHPRWLRESQPATPLQPNRSNLRDVVPDELVDHVDVVAVEG